MALTGMLVLSQVITLIVMVFLSALLLVISVKIFKLKDQSYMTALKIALIIYVINFVLGLIGLAALSVAIVMGVLSFLVLILLGMYLIKKYYKLDWGKAALTWLVWFILTLIVGFIIALIIGIIFAGALIAAI
jgi:hypothetical protein